jgi:glycosyltransferase involved in cell wall biosynthesis
MQAGALDVGIGERQWRGRTVWVAPTDRGRSAFSRLRRLWLGFHHDIRCLFALAHRDRYDAVQVRNKFIVGVLALVVARWRGLKMFYWLSFPEPESRMDGADDGLARPRLANRVRGRLYGFLLYRWILPGCDHAFVQTQRMKQHIINLGIAPEKMTPVPMGVEPGELTRALGRRKRDRAESQFVIAYLGTLNRQRRLEILIDTLALVRQAGVDARLVLVGDGERLEDRALLERRAALANVANHLVITGFLPREEALAEVARADVAVSPIVRTRVLEMGSPTKLVECLGLGVPVVANDHPEQAMVLKESRAGVCVPWDARHFARGVLWLAKQGSANRRLMGERGKRWVFEHRNYRRIADEVEGCYLALLADHR